MHEAEHALADSGMFDHDWYLAQYPDVAAAGLDPISHFLHSGAAEGRNPNPFFDTAWYTTQNPDVRLAGVNPLVHYAKHGIFEGRRPNRLIPADIHSATFCSFVGQAKNTSGECFGAFWYGRPLTALHWACLNSFIELGHQVNLYVYSDLEVPEGVALKNAAEVIAPQNVFLFENKHMSTHDVGPFSDVFRFKLLLEKGGWWVDADVLCNQRSFPNCCYAWAIEQRNTVGTSQIKFPKSDPIIRDLYYRCSALFIRMTNREEIGPWLIGKVLSEHPKVSNFGSSGQFYPLRWIEGCKLWLPQFRDEVQAKTNAAYFIPCWASMASYMKIDQNRFPPKGSYMADVFCRFAADRCSNEVPYEADEILSLVRVWLRNSEWALKQLRCVTEPSLMRLLELDD